MRWRVLTTEQRDDWHDVLRHLPTVDTYFLPEYHRAYEANGEGRARAFVAQEADQVLFYPFMVRPIEMVGPEPVPNLCYDIETVYGYSGPLCNTTNPEFLEGAWTTFAGWCQVEHIVAEFIRFHPLLDNHWTVDNSCSVAWDRDTVAIRLDCSESELWASYPQVHRNMVRKALSKGLTCEEVRATDGLSAFRGLYDSTMERVGAQHRYHFSDAYFECLIEGLGEKLKLFTIRDGDHHVAAALFLLHGDRVHYHLAGSDVRYNAEAPSNLLLHTIAEWGQRQGLRWLHLGGGRTADTDDGLFRFKFSVSRLRFPFYIGKRIHDRQTYEALCSMWMRQRSLTEPPSYFLLYRLQEEATSASVPLPAV